MSLESISEMQRVDMGQCMCSINCTRKYEDNQELVVSAQKVYTMPTLESVSEMQRVDMGQCMCSINCTRKYEDNQELVVSAQKVYKKALKRAS